MEQRYSVTGEHWTALLLCAITTYLLYFTATNTEAANWTRSLGNPDQSCLDAESSDLERDCPVRIVFMK
jgi:hypothetical protein